LFKTTKCFMFLNGWIPPLDHFSKIRCEIGYKVAKEHFDEPLVRVIERYHMYSIGTYKKEYSDRLVQEYTILEESRVKLYKFITPGSFKCPILDIKIEISPAKNYNVKTGVSGDSYVSNRNYLYTLEMQLDTTQMNLSSVGEKQSKSFPLLFGYEFICKGSRYILPPPQLPDSKNWMNEKQFLEADIPMVMNPPSAFEIKEGEKAKLQIVYVVTPNSNQLISFCPKISFGPRGEDVAFVAQLGEKIWLPKNAFVAIKLEYANGFDQRRYNRIKWMGNCFTK
jgi:hypothetical protein